MSNINLLSMRKPHGNAIIIEPGMADRERDTFQCPHCGNHKRIKAGTINDSISHCRLCYQPHCGGPNCWECVPFEKKMEAYERRTVSVGTLGRMLL